MISATDGAGRDDKHFQQDVVIRNRMQSLLLLFIRMDIPVGPRPETMITKMVASMKITAEVYTRKHITTTTILIHSLTGMVRW